MLLFTYTDKKATIQYCKEHPHEIICCIDKDSIALSPKLLKKYNSFQTPLVVADTNSIFTKYIDDKGGKCKELIGTSESIVSFWEEFNGNVAEYAAKNSIKIDTNHTLFYNYSKKDKISVKHGRIYVNQVAPCIIRCGNGINPYLKQLGYDPIKREPLFHELALVCMMIASFFSFKFPLSLGISFLLFSAFVEYQLHLKHYPISSFSKLICLMMDSFHIVLFLVVIYLILTAQCNLKKVVLLDTIYLIIILCFFYFKRCILTILQNKIVNKDVGWTGPIERILYFFNPTHEYVEMHPSMDSWIHGNIETCFLIVLVNINCLCKGFNFIR